MKKSVSLTSFFLFIFQFSLAQFLSDRSSCEITRKSLDQVYNYEFNSARKNLTPVFEKYANHPVSYLIKAQITYWENYPIEGNAGATQSYLSLLEKCKSSAEKLLKEGKFKEEATFYLLSSHGSISRIYHHQKEYFKAAMEAQNAYGYLKDGFNYGDQIPDFLFTKGLYNFYRVQYPETHPQIKPIIYFFKSGNKQVGLENLRQAGKKALFSSIEARYFLTGICLKYENRNVEALNLSGNLYQQYPKNPLFLMRYVEALIANNQLDRASVLVEKMAGMNYPDQRMAYLVFKGLLAQNTGDKEEALNLFTKSLQVTQEGNFTKDLKPMAEVSLARLYYERKEFTKAKSYCKKALDNGEYAWVLKYARELEAKL